MPFWKLLRQIVNIDQKEDIREELAVLTTKIQELERANAMYGHSYYTDQLIKAKSEKARLEFQLEQLSNQSLNEMQG